MSLDKPHIFDKSNGYLIFPPYDTSFLVMNLSEILLLVNIRIQSSINAVRKCCIEALMTLITEFILPVLQSRQPLIWVGM
jgi:hypothetical protein